MKLRTTDTVIVHRVYSEVGTYSTNRSIFLNFSNSFPVSKMQIEAHSEIQSCFGNLHFKVDY